ncbi:Nuclear pore complex protein Nup54 [Phytophthora citrophthora]|uniref:Nuclear pore complex protein Nup54 n=1 Tax=Phytophthora citrophthora TaxID=4793 RepID=A0AAD9GRN4_9STRA|nr:Nuclear pore complex protein Nup54 [Phytophthora citrophthora]
MFHSSVMFGATAGATQPAASGFSFGAGAAAAPAASGGFSFGATPAAPAAAPATGGFGFGAAAPAAPAAGSTGFSFGATPATSTAAPAASSGFSFGATPAAAPAASSGFSFGATPAAAPAASSGFSFGGTSAAPAASGSGFNFGGTATAPAASSGFNFGGTGAAPAAGSTGFSFGGTAAPAASTTPSFGFGSSTAAAATSTTTTGFGFGAKPTTPGTGFGFGSTPTTGFGPATTGSSAFGSGFGTATPGAAPSAFGTAPAASTAPAPIILGADASVAQLNTVKAAYQDPAQSRFKFLMYNTVDPTQRHLYTRPPHISERLWNQAELDNPDPLNCAPVPILGFDNLLKRIKAQQEHAEKYSKFTDDLRAQLKEMDKHTRTTEEKLEKCRHEHVQLFHALVKVMRDIELLQNYGKPLQREEMQLAMSLKKLQTLLNSPGQYKARLNDAVSLQRVQKEAQPAPTSQLSPQDLQRLYELMDKQRQGLEHLTSIINDDLADMQLIKETWRR